MLRRKTKNYFVILSILATSLMFFGFFNIPEAEAAISVTVTAAKIDVTATDAGGNTIDAIYVAVAASAFPTTMVRTGASAPYTYSIPAQVEIEISPNCYIKDYTSGGGILQWSSRSASTTNIFDTQEFSKFELGGDWKIDFDTSNVYYTYVYGQGQIILQGTAGHVVELTHYYILYVYTMEGNLPWDWDYVKLSQMAYSVSGSFLYFMFNDVKPAHTFNNITIYDSAQGGAAARGGISFIGTDDYTGCTFDNFTFDGLYQGIVAQGAAFKFTNSVFKNNRVYVVVTTGAGGSANYLKGASDLTDRNKNNLQQPKITFDNCTFQDNYVANAPNYYAAGYPYSSVVVFKDCTFQCTGGKTCSYGQLSNYGNKSIYVGTTTFNSVTTKRVWSRNGSHYDAKEISITIKDPSGTALEGAQVVVKQAQGYSEEAFSTNSSGQVKDLFGDDPVFVYREETSTNNFTNWSDSVAGGRYHSIIVSKKGYQDYQEDFLLGDVSSFDIRLHATPSGAIKVFGTEYASGEGASTYVEVLDNSGTPVNNATITFTVYDSSGNIVVGYEDLAMTYITGSNGKYRPTVALTAPTSEGVYVIDAVASWTVDSINYYAYGSGEIHVSQSANNITDINNLFVGATGTADSGTTLTLVDNALTQADNFWNGMILVITAGTNAGEVRQITDFETATDKITVGNAFTSPIDATSQYAIKRELNLAEVIWSYTGTSLDTAGNAISKVWSYTGSSLDTAGNAVAKVWSYTGSALDTAGNAISKVWSYTGSALDTASNAIAKVWTSTTRTLTSRQIGGGSEYLPGVTDAGTVTQVANDADQTDIKYNVDLVRAVTFDFAGFADSGTISTLVDSELDQPDDYWNDYVLKIMSVNNFGEEATVLDFDAATHTITVRAGDEFTNPIVLGDKYVLQRETRLIKRIWTWSTDTATFFASAAGEIWGYTGGRTLTSLTSVAGDVWSVATRRLTDKTLTGGGSLATETYIDTAKSDIITQIDANETLISNLDSDISALATDVDAILTKWSTYTASDIIGYIDEIESRLGTAADTSATGTIFGRSKYLQEKWGTQTAQAVFDKADTVLTTVSDVQDEIGYNGSLTTAYADFQLVKGYVDELEGYVGDPADQTTATLFGAIYDVRQKVNQLDTIETKINTLDTIVDAIRASQQLSYLVELSDFGQVETTGTYRAKLTILNYDNNPANASTVPIITLYNPTRTQIDSDSMTALSTGVYEYTYVVPSNATAGLWESIVSVDLGGATAITKNDYWEVEGAPAQVIINSITDSVIPAITANVTITNEGNTGYEYQYEWCVVSTEANQCGGSDDVAYSLAAKYINVGESWITELPATVSSAGNYFFKLVVYFGTEASGASKSFTATSDSTIVVSTGGGGSVSTPNLNDIYAKLLELQTELGYHGTNRTALSDLSSTRISLGAMPDQLSKPFYTILTGISSEIQAVGDNKNYNLNDIYEVLQANTSDIKAVMNKSAELRAMVEMNKTLITQTTAQPVVQTWLTEGSIILNIMVANPPDAARTVEIKEYLPKEIREEDIIEIEEGLELAYDSNLDIYFVKGSVDLGAGEKRIFKVRAEDVFKISEEELTSLSQQAETLIKPLVGTNYFAQASILKSEIDANVKSIFARQAEETSNIERRISTYRTNLKDLEKTRGNVDSLKVLASEAGNNNGIFGKLFSVSTTMTWGIVIIVIVGVGVLAVLLYMILSRLNTRRVIRRKH